MRKIVSLVLVFLVLLSLFPNHALAASNCSLIGSPSGFGVELDDYSPGVSHTVSFNLGNYDNDDYTLVAATNSGGGLGSFDTRSPRFTLGQSGTFSNGDGVLTVQGTTVIWKITDENSLSAGTFGDKTIYVKLYDDSGLVSWGYKCTVGSYTVTKESTGSVATSCELKVWQERNGEECGTNGCMENSGLNTYYEATNMTTSDGSLWSGGVIVKLGVSGGTWLTDQIKQATNGSVNGSFEAKKVGTYSITVTTKVGGSDGTTDEETLCPKRTFDAVEDCGDTCAPPGDLYDSSQSSQPPFELCEQVTAETKETCLNCLGSNGIWTAIGCIPIDPTSIIQTLITLGLSLGGGITLLLILAGAFRLSVSAGDPKQAEEAKEQITSAVIGLLFIIFSIVILRFIGVQVLQIPGFGG